MGTRKNEKKATTTQSGTTDYTGAFKSYDITPEEQELKEWAPDRTLADAGTKASFGAARQGIVEGVGGYSGITNPVLAARMQEIALQELADRESSALTAAGAERNRLGLQNKQFLASLRRPQWVLKAIPTNDVAIPGQIIVTVNFPATPARVASQSVDLPHKYVYVEQMTPPTGGTVEKISIYLI
jgi:hypothetical protein